MGISSTQTIAKNKTTLSESALKALKESAQNELAFRDFSRFVTTFWPIVDSAPFQPSFVTRILCQELTALLEHLKKDTSEVDKRCYELVINVPPGFAKSLICAVLFPAWVWLHDPGLPMLFVSNVPKLALRDANRMRTLVKSDGYKAITSHLKKSGRCEEWGISRARDQVSVFANSLHGVRQSYGIGETITGARCRLLGIDDPLNASDIVNGSISSVDRLLEEVNNSYDNVLESRLTEHGTTARLIVMQRLHENDLAGHVSKKPGVRTVVIPQEFDPSRRDIHPLDPRKTKGEVIIPANADLVAQRKQDMLPEHFEAQQNQGPKQASLTSALSHSKWFKFRVESEGVYLGEKFVRYSDMTIASHFDSSDGGDDGALSVIGRWNDLYFCIGNYTYTNLPLTEQMIRAVRDAGGWTKHGLKTLQYEPPPGAASMFEQNLYALLAREKSTLQISAKPSTTNKEKRILNTLEPLGASARLGIPTDLSNYHLSLIRSFDPSVTSNRDDYLDAIQRAIEQLQSAQSGLGYAEAEAAIRKIFRR